MTSINFNANSGHFKMPNTSQENNCPELNLMKEAGFSVLEGLKKESRANWQMQTIMPKCKGCEDQATVLIFADQNFDGVFNPGEAHIQIQHDCDMETPLEFSQNGKVIHEEHAHLFLGRGSKAEAVEDVIKAFNNNVPVELKDRVKIIIDRHFGNQ